VAATSLITVEVKVRDANSKVMDFRPVGCYVFLFDKYLCFSLY
jgi:hypothetical protein